MPKKIIRTAFCENALRFVREQGLAQKDIYTACVKSENVKVSISRSSVERILSGVREPSQVTKSKFVEVVKDLCPKLAPELSISTLERRTFSSEPNQHILALYHKYLTDSRGAEYTEAKESIARWGDQYPGAFQSQQIHSANKFGPLIQNAWLDYCEDRTGRGDKIHNPRKPFNKFWDRLVQDFECSKAPYGPIFEVLGDNLRLLAITQPLEILLAQMICEDDKPNLRKLLTRFTEWLEINRGHKARFIEKGFRVKPGAAIWTLVWPWRV